MVTDRLYSLQQLQQSQVLQFMDDVIKEIYPRLFEQLYVLQSKLSLLNTEHRAVQMTLAEKIGYEMDATYSKEKLVLFPFIRTLHIRQQRSESCKPFKNVKLHYTVMLSLITELKFSLQAEEDQVNSMISNMWQCVASLEKQLIMLQITKDKFLFVHYKSCQGCKIGEI